MAIKEIIYGFIIGGLMLIPGVSGGSIAVYFGIYDKIIDNIANIKNNFKKNIFFLIKLLIGALISVIIFSNIYRILFFHYETYIKITVGIVFIIIGIIEILKNKILNNLKSFFWFIIGFLFPLMFSLLPINNINPPGVFSVFLLCLPLSLALILPGISFSYSLLILGLYDSFLKAISTFDIQFIVILGSGILIGILLFTKMINYINKFYPIAFKSCIWGFVLFSSIQILPIE